LGNSNVTRASNRLGQLLLVIEQSLAVGDLLFATYFQEWMLPYTRKAKIGRRRDLLPLPPIEEWPLEVECANDDISAMLTLANLTVAAINFMGNNFKSKAVAMFGMRPTFVQQESLLHVCQRCHRHYARMVEHDAFDDSFGHGFDHFEGSLAPQYEKIDPEAIDRPPQAATCVTPARSSLKHCAI
jgi:hypothetical protein